MAAQNREVSDLMKAGGEPNQKTRWGFLGAGKMASALIRGMIRSGLATPDSIVASDPVASIRDQLSTATGIQVTPENLEVLRLSDVVVLAVKPQMIQEAIGSISSQGAADRLLVSIAAGVPMRDLVAQLDPRARVVRAMPNTPALIGSGASAYCNGPGVTARDEALVRDLLESVGLVQKVPETLIDAVTGLSGSGPAFVYAMIEAMSDGGVHAGLPRAIATELAAQTMLGAARMVLETKEHPGALKDQVTSPSGTTIAGLRVLEGAGIRGALMEAVIAAASRSAALASSAITSHNRD